MKILLDKLELKYLLEQKRDNIGPKFIGYEDVLTGLFFILPILGTDFNDILFIPGLVLKTICCIIAIITIFRGCIKMYSSYKNSYNQDQLFDDINNINQIMHPFSIVAIKDTFNEYPNRFLLYYDEQWDCKFFFNYKTMENDTFNEENIKVRLANELHIDKESIKLEFKTEAIQRKYSVKDSQYKVYDHKVYRADISQFSDLIKKTEFEINNKKFYWMSIEDMKKDKRIREINSDVVSLVNDVII